MPSGSLMGIVASGGSTVSMPILEPLLLRAGSISDLAQNANVTNWIATPLITGISLSVATGGVAPIFNESNRRINAVRFRAGDSQMTLNTKWNSFNSCGIITFQAPSYTVQAGVTINLINESQNGVSIFIDRGTSAVCISYGGQLRFSQTMRYFTWAPGYVYTAAWRLTNAASDNLKFWLVCENQFNYTRETLASTTTTVPSKVTMGTVVVGGQNAGHIHEIRLYSVTTATESTFLTDVANVDAIYSGAPERVHRLRIWRTWTGNWEANYIINIAGLFARKSDNTNLLVFGGSVKGAAQFDWDWDKVTDGIASTFSHNVGQNAGSGTLEGWVELWVNAEVFASVHVDNRDDDTTIQARIRSTKLQLMRSGTTTWVELYNFGSFATQLTYDITVSSTNFP